MWGNARRKLQWWALLILPYRVPCPMNPLDKTRLADVKPLDQNPLPQGHHLDRQYCQIRVVRGGHQAAIS